ncbi:Ribosomal RNA small subunit methyltransferase A [Burkholderiales bacterium]|nr:Ribosomal RNA small subunit methyltransferase A [Burkholderiales bacterium]
MPRVRGRTVEGHVARKRFGQNFLADPHYVARIADAVAPRPGETVVEIGPGLGALTAQLVARAGRVVAIEIDRDLAARLRGRFPPHALELVVGDALAFDFRSLGCDLRVVGNLPYNISSPLLFHLAAQADALRDLTVMLQKEVVARMTAEPATPEYGRLTVMLRATFAVERLFVVPPAAFRPPPKVDSAVARLVPLRAAAPRIADAERFARVVAAAFGQRRKTLRNALDGVVAPAAFAAAGIDPMRRGETLSIAEFVALAGASGETAA